MLLRVSFLVTVPVLLGVSASAQTLTPTSAGPFSVGVIGGLAAGRGDAGGSIGGTVAFDVTDRIGVEARGLRSDRGSGERGLEVSGAMSFTLVRTARAEPYVSVGGGVYRASFDLGDPRFFGMMSGQYAAGTQFVPIQGMHGYAMMTGGTTYRGMMWQGAWSGPTFSASQMPMFYAGRLGAMTVPMMGQLGMRTFTDPALTFGGGMRINLTNRLYLAPDLRGVAVFSSGDHLTMVTMNVGLGVRF